jgi:L-aminopeptidase/D-esterase-like protein
MAWAACEGARATGIAEGSVGAGTGATWGKARGAAHARKGGVGCAVVARDGLAAGAVMVVNAFGTVRDAAGRPMDGATAAQRRDLPASFADAAGRNTTIGVVVVSLPLSTLALRTLAQAATGAFHRRIAPAGSPFDGDVLFALAPMSMTAAGAPPGRHDSAASGDARHQARAGAIADAPAGIDPDPGTALALEIVAAEAVEEAIERAVRQARGRDGVPGLADDAPSATIDLPTA